jgi:hypothetical protein
LETCTLFAEGGVVRAATSDVDPAPRCRGAHEGSRDERLNDETVSDGDAAALSERGVRVRVRVRGVE